MEYIYFIKFGIAGALLFCGYFAIGRLVRRLTRLMTGHLPADVATVLGYFIFYGFYGLFASVTLQSVGVDISAIITAAGIAGVAIGFAAQTSFTNIISGIMLVIERPFKVGDIINTDGVEGTIESIGLLSFSLRTIDNKLVRIPNEQLIKNRVTNLTGYGYRKIGFTVSYDASVDGRELIEKLMQRATNCSYRFEDRPVTVEYDTASNYAVGATIYFWVKARQATAARSAYIELCAPIVGSYGAQAVYIAVKQ